jgi:saposin
MQTEAAFEAALDKVCIILPASLKDKCMEFVATYGPVLPQLIARYITPDQVCNALRICQNGTEVKDNFQPNKPLKNEIECTLCKYVLSYVNVLISSNATARDIERALEFVCPILPSQYRSQCTTFVQQYGPILAELIAELDDPNVVCQWLSFCPKSNDAFIEIPPLERRMNSVTCNMCEYVVNYLDAAIQSNSTETEVAQLLENACTILPGAIQGTCKADRTLGRACGSESSLSTAWHV